MTRLSRAGRHAAPVGPWPHRGTVRAADTIPERGDADTTAGFHANPYGGGLATNGYGGGLATNGYGGGLATNR